MASSLGIGEHVGIVGVLHLEAIEGGGRDGLVVGVVLAGNSRDGSAVIVILGGVLVGVGLGFQGSAGSEEDHLLRVLRLGLVGLGRGFVGRLVRLLLVVVPVGRLAVAGLLLIVVIKMIFVRVEIHFKVDLGLVVEPEIRPEIVSVARPVKHFVKGRLVADKVLSVVKGRLFRSVLISRWKIVILNDSVFTLSTHVGSSVMY